MSTEHRFKAGKITLFKQPKSPFYTLRLMFKGRRRQFSTGETSKATASDKARAILADLKSRGLVETVKLHSAAWTSCQRTPRLKYWPKFTRR